MRCHGGGLCGGLVGRLLDGRAGAWLERGVQGDDEAVVAAAVSIMLLDFFLTYVNA